MPGQIVCAKKVSTSQLDSPVSRQSQAFSPRGEGIKVKFLVEGKAVLFCSGAYNIEFFKCSKLLKGFL